MNKQQQSHRQIYIQLYQLLYIYYHVSKHNLPFSCSSLIIFNIYTMAINMRKLVTVA